eukprot:83657-Rhodomonas_salina.2
MSSTDAACGATRVTYNVFSCTDTVCGTAKDYGRPDRYYRQRWACLLFRYAPTPSAYATSSTVFAYAATLDSALI